MAFHRFKPVPGVAIALLALLCLATTMPATVYANDLPEAGVPASHQIPFDPDILTQTFSLARLPQGDVVVGTSSGLLRFDGERWHSIASPNGQLVRSLLVDRRGQLWVGGYDLFARAGFSPAGDLQFEPLSDELPDSVPDTGFADIWDIFEHGDNIWFRGVRDLFRYHRASGDIQHFRHDQRFGSGFVDNGEFFLQFRQRGLHRFNGSDFELVSDDPQWREFVLDIVPTPDGRWIGHNREGQWLIMTPDRIERFSFPGLPEDQAYFDATALPNGDIALAGRDGGIHIIDLRQQRYRRLPVSEDPLFHLSRTGEGGILAVSDLALVHMRWPADWSALSGVHGLRGNVHGVANWNDRWLALTQGDVLLWQDSRERFEASGWTPNEAWAFHVLGPDSALLGESYSLLHLTSPTGQATPISSATLYPRLIQASEYWPDRLFIGTELGLAALSIRDTSAPEMLWVHADLATRVDTIAETATDELWLGTATRGVMRVGLNAAGDIASVDAIGMPELSSESYAALTFVHQGQVHASTVNGVYRWNGARFENADGSDFPPHRADTLQSFQRLANGQRWALSEDRLLRRTERGEWVDETPDSLRRGAFQSMDSHQGQLLLTANARILVHTDDRAVATAADNPAPPPQLRLQDLELRAGDGAWQSLALTTEGLEVPAEHFALAFRYALPSVGPADSTQYRARLVGYEEDFNEWGRGTRITYSRLRPGEYEFHAQARDHLGRISELRPFRFTAVPLWHGTWPARLVFILLAAVALAWLVRALIQRRTARLKAEQQRLANMVEERTQELSIANRKLEAMAHLDGLTGIPNRRKLDDYLGESLQQCQERQRPLSIILFDVDHFKHYNDSHGHQAGDAVLEGLAREAAHCLRRQQDLLARYGGEEFLIILPSADRQMALEVAEELRAHIADSTLGITISAGVATASPDQPSSPEGLLQRADQALYRAKYAGRNRVGAPE